MYKSSIQKSIVAVAAILLSTPVLSAEENENVVVITANRVEQNINDTLAAVEVITREDIDRIQPESITDLLQSIAGLDFVHNGGAGQASALYTRGTNSDHTLVLIDGVRVGSATLGNKTFSSIPVAQIERIEVVKGPRAALWGSDAIGGVIQIFTRRLLSGEASVSITAGTDSFNSANVSAGFGNEKIINTVTFSYEKSDGYDVFDDSGEGFDDSQPDNDGYDRMSAAIRGDYTLSTQTQLDWVLQFDKGSNEFDSSFGGNKADYNNHLWNIRYTYRLEDLMTQLSVKQSRDQSITFGNGTKKSEGSVFETRRQQINGLAQYQFSDSASLTAGIDHLIDDVSSSDLVSFDGSINDYDETERTTESAFLSGNFRLDGFIAELTGRYDDVEKVKGYGTFNASLGYKVNNYVTVSANRSKGFKAPTFNDLYYPGFSDPELKSETSFNTEFLVKANWQEHSLLLAHYNNQVDQLIAYNPACFCSQNIDSADISGLELVYSFRHGSFNHKLSASNLDPMDESIDSATGAPKNIQLLRRSKEQYGYELVVDLGNFSFFTQLNHTGSRFDEVFGGPRQRLESYLQVNLGATYQVNDNWSVKLKVNDATDEESRTILGYNNVGRQVFLTAQWLNF
ncbi:MAG: TonB-dependent receptor [Kangiellaceae bacterium]|nr:TonB-dependent receptor [Kangiellaceae bacterium]